MRTWGRSAKCACSAAQRASSSSSATTRRRACEDLGERAEAGADLDDGVGGADFGGVGDALEDARRDEEVLAEALAGLQAKAAEQASGGGLRWGFGASGQAHG